ncbi:hypothetical protein BKA18_000022 [Streptomyces auratus]
MSVPLGKRGKKKWSTYEWIMLFLAAVGTSATVIAQVR